MDGLREVTLLSVAVRIVTAIIVGGLIGLERIVLMPHSGSNTYDDRCEMARACSRQILDVLAGRRPGNIVNGV